MLAREDPRGQTGETSGRRRDGGSGACRWWEDSRERDRWRAKVEAGEITYAIEVEPIAEHKFPRADGLHLQRLDRATSREEQLLRTKISNVDHMLHATNTYRSRIHERRRQPVNADPVGLGARDASLAVEKGDSWIKEAGRKLIMIIDLMQAKGRRGRGREIGAHSGRSRSRYR